MAKQQQHEDLDWLLKEPLGPNETVIERANKVLVATRWMSDNERMEAVVQIIVPMAQLKKPKHRPGIAYDFLKRHDWIPWLEEGRDLVCPLITDNIVVFYHQLFLEMEARGGNLKAAREIVKLEYLPTLGGAVQGTTSYLNIWYVPIEKERRRAADAILRFYRNRARVAQAVEQRSYFTSRHAWLFEKRAYLASLPGPPSDLPMECTAMVHLTPPNRLQPKLRTNLPQTS